MIGFITWFLHTACRTFLWAIATFLKAGFSWIVWILWPLLLLAGLVSLGVCTAAPAEAGWTDWFWGNRTDQQQLNRAADLAGESARIAGRVAAAQAQHASEQARQNSQVAEMLNQLSVERQEYSHQLEHLATAAARDSEWAAALGTIGTVGICLAVLLIAALVVWMGTRADAGSVTSPAVVDLLIGELCEKQAPEKPRPDMQITLSAAGQTRSTQHLIRLPQATPGVALLEPPPDRADQGPYGMDEDGCPF